MSLCGGPNCPCKSKATEADRTRPARHDPPPRPRADQTRPSKDEKDLNEAESIVERLLDEVRVNTKRIGLGEITD